MKKIELPSTYSLIVVPKAGVMLPDIAHDAYVLQRTTGVTTIMEFNEKFYEVDLTHRELPLDKMPFRTPEKEKKS